MDAIQKEFNDDVQKVLEEVAETLRFKNQRYGDAALNPLKVFSQSPAKDRLQARLDEKLARIIYGQDVADDEDTLMDLIGLLVIYRVDQLRNEHGIKEEEKARHQGVDKDGG